MCIRDRYYLGADGKAYIGWQDIDGSSYYFEQDGKMATGEVWLGLTLCVFDENGVLISKKESAIDPVSYTHLDVYKRQDIDR